MDHRPPGSWAPAARGRGRPRPARARPRRSWPGWPCRTHRRRGGDRPLAQHGQEGEAGVELAQPSEHQRIVEVDEASPFRVRGPRPGRAAAAGSWRRAALARSWLRVLVATAQPPSSGPSSAEAGTRTSSRNTSANSASPVRVRSGRALDPGERMSTTRQEMPWCLATSGLVRTKSAHQSATVPDRGPDLLPGHHEVVAVAHGPGPQRRQVRAGRARSCPGTRCRRRGPSAGSQVRFARSVPYCMIDGAMLLMPMTFTGVGAPDATILLGEHELFEYGGARPLYSTGQEDGGPAGIGHGPVPPARMASASWSSVPAAGLHRRTSSVRWSAASALNSYRNASTSRTWKSRPCARCGRTRPHRRGRRRCRRSSARPLRMSGL